MGKKLVREELLIEARCIVQTFIDHWRAGHVITDEIARSTIDRAHVFLAKEYERQNLAAPRQCVQCGLMFTPKRASKARYCSTACQRIDAKNKAPAKMNGQESAQITIKKDQLPSGKRRARRLPSVGL